MMKKPPVISIKNVEKSFQVGEQMVQVLSNISLDIADGDFVVIIGPSGSGKSTFLHTILGLEAPSKGNIQFMNEDLYSFETDDQRANFRKTHIGMVYQQSNWIKSLSVIENIAFPAMLLGEPRDVAIERAMVLLKEVGLEKWADYLPTELSSGQQQRVAVARALINNPQIIIADEPTGNLDYISGQHMMELLSELNKKQSKTIIMVTHDLEYIYFANTVVHIFDGKISGIYTGKDKKKVLKDIKYKRGVLTTTPDA